MPEPDHTGPEKEGPKTGRKSGKYHKTDIEQAVVSERGKGLGKRKLSGGGKGKRLTYNQL